jgi:hypothetical protein
MGLGIRWTIGDVSAAGFEALRLSIWGAFRLFGDDAAYVVCVNTVPVPRARALAGDLPRGVAWIEADPEVSAFLRPHLDARRAEGLAWKLNPLQVFPDHHELSLDNDCILWDVPRTLRAWLADPSPDACLIAEDVRPSFGQFADLCGAEPRHAGIRGFAPGFDLERRLGEVLRRRPVPIVSELDEQGLHVAALSLGRPPHVVRTADVSICSPFPPQQPDLGRCGAHFVGLNARSLGWRLGDRPAEDLLLDHFLRHRPDLYARVGLPPRRAR